MLTSKFQYREGTFLIRFSGFLEVSLIADEQNKTHKIRNNKNRM